MHAIRNVALLLRHGSLDRGCNHSCVASVLRLRNPSKYGWPHFHSRRMSSVAENASPQGPQLRPYQEESIQAVLSHLAQGHRRLGISLATGGGKTVIFSHLINRVPAPQAIATQTLVLAHRRELVLQARNMCRQMYPTKSIEVEMGSNHATGTADITVASLQSIVSGDRLSRYDPNRFKLVLVDEAHHIVSPSYQEVLRHFRLLDKQAAERSDTVLVGVSATFSRPDGLSLGKAIDHIVFHKDYLSMIEEEWLAGLKFTTVRSGADLSRVQHSGGDFQSRALSNAVNIQSINETTVKSWLSLADGRKSTLVFCVDLDHVAALTKEFRRHGLDARSITGNTHNTVRESLLRSFKAGEFPVLVNCGIFTEGTDIPNIDCVLLARPTRSRNLLVQMMGRGLRRATGKVDCHIIDMVATLETGITTTPTLFGLDPDELLEASSGLELKKLAETKRREMVQTPKSIKSQINFSDDPISFTHYDNVNDLLDDTAGERHIRSFSRYAWVRVDDHRYILSDTSGSFLTIDRVDTAFRVSLTRKLPPQSFFSSKRSKAPFAKPYILAQAETFEDAVHAADTYAADKFVHRMLLVTAGWRRSEASEGQLEILRRFLGHPIERPELLNKGRAGNWITKLKHGARGQVNRTKTEIARIGRIEQRKAKWRLAQEDSQVKVGPIAQE